MEQAQRLLNPLVKKEWLDGSVHGVRRDKAALSSGCKPHPATAPAGSTGAVMEVTKWLKPSDSVSRYTVTARVSGRNASERRASLEKDDAQADPTAISGKADTAG